MRHYLVPYNRKEEDDPVFREFTYGHKTALSNVQVGEYLFFHTKILSKRYLTAYYQVFDKKTVAEIKKDKLILNKYRNPHIDHGSDMDIVVFGHPIYSYILEKPLLLNDILLKELVGNKKIGPGKLIMNKGAEDKLLKLIETDQEKSLLLNEVSLTTEDIYHLREYDIEIFMKKNSFLLGASFKLIDSQKKFDDNSRLDLLFKDDRGFVVIEIKKGLINQDVYKQIKGYINNLKREKNTEKVRGIIVCRGFDSDQSKKFYTDKILEGKVEIFFHAWKFDLKKVSPIDLINI